MRLIDSARSRISSSRREHGHRLELPLGDGRRLPAEFLDGAHERRASMVVTSNHRQGRRCAGESASDRPPAGPGPPLVFRIEHHQPIGAAANRPV